MKKHTFLSIAMTALALLVSLPALAADSDDTDMPELRVSLLITNRGVFDPGMRLFSTQLYATGATLRAGYTLMPLFAFETGYTFGEVGGPLTSSGSSLLTSHIIEAGLRVDSPWSAGPITPYLRGGGNIWIGRAHFKDQGRYHDWAANAGVYGGGGLALHATLRETLGSTAPRGGVGVNVEVGHLQSFSELTFDPFGKLKTGGVYYSAGIDLTF